MRLKRFLCHVFAYFAACELAALVLTTAARLQLYREGGFQNWLSGLDAASAYGSLKDILQVSLYAFVGSTIICLIPVLATVFLTRFIAQQYHPWLFSLGGGLVPVGIFSLLNDWPPDFVLATMIATGAASGLAYYLVLRYLRGKWIKPPAIDVTAFD